MRAGDAPDASGSLTARAQDPLLWLHDSHSPLERHELDVARDPRLLLALRRAEVLRDVVVFPRTLQRLLDGCLGVLGINSDLLQLLPRVRAAPALPRCLSCTEIDFSVGRKILPLVSVPFFRTKPKRTVASVTVKYE